jgi:hypothetical protein
MRAQPLGGADRLASDPLGDPARPDHRGPDGLTQNKYVAMEIDAKARRAGEADQGR